MWGTDRRPGPWWLAAGAGAAAGVLAGLSLARPLPLALAGVILVLGLRGSATSTAVTAGVAGAVSTIFSLGAELALPVRAAIALTVGVAGAGVILAVRHLLGRRAVTVAGVALVAMGLSVVPPIVLRRDPEPFVAELVQRTSLDVDRAQAYLAKEVRDGRLPALVFGVAEQGEPVRYVAFGTTGPHGEPVRPDTRFRIGSMSKSFTALAVVRLAHAGRIDLERPVADYLDWFAPRYPPGREPVTVAELLDHSSGISNSAGWELLAGGADPVGGMEEAVAATRLLPRGEVEYSNANYIIAAAIVEAVTGDAFADHLVREVIDPLRLTATTPHRPAGDDLARGHRLWFGVPVRSTAPFLDFAVPAGFVTSSAVDLLAYVDQVVRADSAVVTPGMRRDLLDAAVIAPHSPVGEAFAGQRYAKGWVRGPVAGIDVVWHSGGLADFNSVMVSHPEGDWSFVVLISTASQINALMPAITENVTAILHGGEAPGPGAGRTVTDTYLLVDLGVVAAALLLTWATTTLIRRPAPARVAAIGTVSTVVLVGLLLAAPALSGFPAAARSPDDQIAHARVLTTYVPDIGWSLLAIAGASALLAGTSLALLGTAARSAVTRDAVPRRAGRRAGRRGAAR